MPRPEDPGSLPQPHQLGCFPWASCSLTHSPTATCSISGLYQHFRVYGHPCGLQLSLCTLHPLCSPPSQIHSTRALRHRRNTRYGWVVSPYPTGTLTPQDTPSFAWRNNGQAHRRQWSIAELPSECSALLGVYSAPRFFRIFLANGSFTSLCRGTASITPLFGFIQRECDPPSLFR